MCHKTDWDLTTEKAKEFLSNNTKTITAYKIARKHGNVYQTVYRDATIHKNNCIKQKYYIDFYDRLNYETNEINAGAFHLFYDLNKTKRFIEKNFLGSLLIIKCTVKVEDIITFGYYEKIVALTAYRYTFDSVY